MEKNERLYAIIATTFWVILIVAGIVFLFMIGAFAQVPIDKVLEDYAEDNLEGCEVWQIHYAMYTPVRIELDYEFAVEREPKISSNDPESDVDVFSTPTKMNIVTDSIDFHTIDLFINYENQTSAERRVDYRIYTNDGILTQEGNWHDTGSYFCKTLMFWAEPAPDFPTPEEVRAEERAFFDEQLGDIKTNQDESEGFFGIALIIVLVIGTLVAILVITNWWNQRTMSKPIDDARALIIEEKKKMENTRSNLKNTITLQQLGNKKVMKDLKEMIEGFVSLTHSKEIKTQSKDAPTSTQIVSEQKQELRYDVPNDETGGIHGTAPMEITSDEAEFEKPEPRVVNLTKEFRKSVTSVFKKQLKEGEPMTIEEMTKEFEQRTREENQKEYEELCKLYEIQKSEDDWIILNALNEVMQKQV